MIVRKVTPEENKRVNEIFAIAFEMAPGKEPFIGTDENVTTWAAFDGADMTSTLSESRFSIQFDGHSCLMGGMGGAASLPQYRRMGGIRGCFEHSLVDQYEKGYDFSYLYPFSTAYYRKYGYERCIQHLQVTLDLGLLRVVDTEGHFVLTSSEQPHTEAIRAVNQVWEQKFNMMVLHDDDFYDWTKKVQPAVDLNFTYVYYAKDGSPKAYTTFHMEYQTDGRNLICSRLFFTDAEGFMGLMGIFKSLSSDHRFAKFTLPYGQGLEYLMPEWSMGAAQWTVNNNAGMVRVVNVPNVLMKAAYRGSGQVSMEIEDRQIPENNGIFTVSFEKGKAVKVEKTQASPDVRLSMPAFSALISGAADLSQADAYIPGTEVFTDNAALHQVFYRKPLMIVDYF